MLYGLKTLTIGFHSTIHSLAVIIAWRKIYHEYPDSREFISILLHDIGYLFQSDHYLKPPRTDNHPELGAIICGAFLGEKYMDLCLGHSREYAHRYNFKLSKLCYADKYALLILPPTILKLINIVEPINLKCKTEFKE